MNDVQEFLEAVRTMRAAQKLEWQSLPSNYDRYRRAREKQSIARLEERVDAMAKELTDKYMRPGDEKQGGT